MAVAETARLIASLELKDQLSKPADRAIGKIGKLEGAVGKVGKTASAGLKTAGKAVAGIGAVGAVFIGAQVQQGLQSLAALEDATTQVDAAIKQMGKSGQVTAGQVADWANEIEASVDAAFDDKDITSAAATLIRFGKVTTSNLKPALVVMTDLAAKTGSIESASTLLARALADPTKAAGKLARAGVILTKAQQDQIKAMVKVGDVAGAQKVVLDALTKSTKGAAAASKGEYADSLNILADTVEDAQRALAVGFLPIIKEVRDILSKELAKPQTLQAIKDFGTGAAGVLRSLIDAAKRVPWSAIGEGLRVAGQGAKTILDAFLGLPPWVQTAVVTGWGLNKLTGGALSGIVGELGKGLVKGVLGMTAGVVNIKAATVTGAGGPGSVADAAGRGLNVKSLITTAGAALIGAEIAKSVTDVLGGVGGGIFEKLFPNIPDIGEKFEQGFGELTKIIGGPLQSLDLLNNLDDIPGRISRDLGKLGDFIGGRVDIFGNRIGTAANETTQAVRQMGPTTAAAAAAVVAEVAGTTKAVEAASAAARAQYRTANALTEKIGKTPFQVVKEATQTGKADSGTFAVIGNLVRAFTQGRTPWAQDLGNIKGHLANLKSLQAKLIAEGDTKGAQKIGGYIKTLQGVLAGKLDKLVPKAPKPFVPIKEGDTRSETSGIRFNQGAITDAVDKTTTAVKTTGATTAAAASAAATASSATTTAVNTQGAATAAAAQAAATASGATTTAVNASGAATTAAVAAGATKTATAATAAGATTAAAATAAATASGATTAAVTAGAARTDVAIRQTGATTAAASAAQQAATRAAITAGDTRSEAAQARTSAAVTAGAARTDTAIRQTGATTAAAAAAQQAATRATIASGDTRSEAAIARTSAAVVVGAARTDTAIRQTGASTAASAAAQQQATRAAAAGQAARSEAAMSRIQAATSAVRATAASGLSSVRQAANATAAAVRNKDLSVSVSVPVRNTVSISTRGVIGSQTYIARFNQRGIT